MAGCFDDVRSTPESGHVQRNSACPLSANSGHANLIFGWAKLGLHSTNGCAKILKYPLNLIGRRLIGSAVLALDFANSDHVVRIPDFAAFLLGDEMFRVAGKGSD